MARKKSYREKLNNSKDLPRIEIITEKMTKMWGNYTPAFWSLKL